MAMSPAPATVKKNPVTPGMKLLGGEEPMLFPYLNLFLGIGKREQIVVPFLPVVLVMLLLRLI